MKNYFRENRRIFIISLAVIILLVFLHSLKITAPLENGLFYLLKPVQSGLVSFSHSFSRFFGRFAEINDLLLENSRLKLQINELTIENNILKTTLKENEIITPQVKFLQEKNYDFVMARVISRSVDPTFKTLMINRGKKDGLNKGMPVVVDQGFLVGKISQIESNRAEVILLNDARSTTFAQVQNDEASPGMVTGEFGLSLKMDFIPKEDKIEEGQFVITNGLENFIPKGLVIGQIENIKIKTGDFFQTATLTPANSYDLLEVISVIIHF